MKGSVLCIGLGVACVLLAGCGNSPTPPAPTSSPTSAPTLAPTNTTNAPTPLPPGATASPTAAPTNATNAPTSAPTSTPTSAPPAPPTPPAPPKPPTPPGPPTPSCTSKDEDTNGSGTLVPCCDGTKAMGYGSSFKCRRPTSPEDAGRCKATAHFAEDGRVCDNFYDSDTGVAISMISLGTWAGTGAGSAGMDKAVFNVEPPSHVIKGAEQAISITHFQKSTWVYGAASQYGVLYGLGPQSMFWRFFTTCPQVKDLCAQCTDGFRCPVVSAPSVARQPLGDMTFEEFKASKNKIVGQTGTSSCKNNQVRQYNEFDTNGLSSADLAGVFVVRNGGAAGRVPAPPDSDVCKLLKAGNPKRQKPWPLYAYNALDDNSSLGIERYLDCKALLQTTPQEVAFV